ncbi:MAG: MBL fold metallo-hydrolase [Ruminococcaceae bacterium]|nr:MBL fold metallo-hydrolase [Oscillospiraceae bacterium]
MYDLNKVGEHTYYIDAPTNLGIYLYNGNKVCMIDGGSDSDAAKKALQHIEANGWTLEMVLNTHCHADHTGGCAYLADRTGCRNYAPGADAAIMRYSYLNPTYLFGGFPMKELENKFTLAPPCDCLPLTEDVLPEGLTCLHVDGHSFEQLAFRTSDDVWFMADSLISAETFPKYKIAFLYDIQKHLDTLDRISRLNGKLFIPSHCTPLTDIQQLAAINRDNVYEVAEDIKRLCRDGLTIDELLEQLFAEYRIRLYIMQYALVGYTTRSYLSWLSARGEIAPVFDGTRLLWKTVS